MRIRCERVEGRKRSPFFLKNILCGISGGITIPVSLLGKKKNADNAIHTTIEDTNGSVIVTVVFANGCTI